MPTAAATLFLNGIRPVSFPIDLRRGRLIERRQTEEDKEMSEEKSNEKEPQGDNGEEGGTSSFW